MSTLVSLVSIKLSVLTVLANLIVIALVVSWVIERRGTRLRPNGLRRGEGGELALTRFVRTHALGIGFVAALIAMLGSLFFSEIAGYAPCTLCWYQRILMYPQVFILGLALLKRDRGIAPYALLLSGIGAVIALYHYYLQLGGNPLIPCGAVGYSVSCAQRFTLEFGYITIPFMAFSAFLLIAAAMLLDRKSR